MFAIAWMMLAVGMRHLPYPTLLQVLSAQELESGKDGQSPAHDEHLFIVIHQVYELWFKQVLHELKSVQTIFTPKYIPEKHMSIAVSRLQRVSEIMRVLVSQLSVLETMSPLSFLEFRDKLNPASGKCLVVVDRRFSWTLLVTVIVCPIHPQAFNLYNSAC